MSFGDAYSEQPPWLETPWNTRRRYFPPKCEAQQKSIESIISSVSLLMQFPCYEKSELKEKCQVSQFQNYIFLTKYSCLWSEFSKISTVFRLCLHLQ
jgi:hypothetical protein